MTFRGKLWKLGLNKITAMQVVTVHNLYTAQRSIKIDVLQ